jgi:hypothetical protein
LCRLEVKMWRKNACRRFTFPFAVFLKRLAAPLWVFNFGINARDLTFPVNPRNPAAENNNPGQ